MTLKKICLPDEEKSLKYNPLIPNVCNEIPISEDNQILEETKNPDRNISKNYVNITYDTGHYVRLDIDDLTKKNLILHPWVPDKNYSFAFSIHKKRVRKKDDMQVLST